MHENIGSIGLCMQCILYRSSKHKGVQSQDTLYAVGFCTKGESAFILHISLNYFADPFSLIIIIEEADPTVCKMHSKAPMKTI